MDKIIVNETARFEKVQSAYQTNLETIKKQAANGQRYFTIQFHLPNYMDGFEVQKKLEAHGIECCERGFSSVQQDDGSYSFRIHFRMKD